MATSGSFGTNTKDAYPYPCKYTFYWYRAEISGNSSRIHIQLYGDGGAGGGYYQKNYGARLYLNGSLAAQREDTINLTQGYMLFEGDWWLSHDANGNLNFRADANGDLLTAAQSVSGWGQWDVDRIAAAPVYANSTADTITNTTARLGNEISSYGNGTSCAMRMYYKTPSAGGWAQTGDQGDVGGYNYWTVSSLTPNTTYYYFPRMWNNMGDTSDGTQKSFKTLASGGVTGVTNLKYNKATINVGMNASGSGESNATVKVQYKRSVDSSWLDSSTSTSLTPAITLTGLKPNTVYDYRVVATNSTGTWTGSTATLKTKNAPGFIFIMEDY